MVSKADIPEQCIRTTRMQAPDTGSWCHPGCLSPAAAPKGCRFPFGPTPYLPAPCRCCQMQHSISNALGACMWTNDIPLCPWRDDNSSPWLIQNYRFFLTTRTASQTCLLLFVWYKEGLMSSDTDITAMHIFT